MRTGKLKPQPPTPPPSPTTPTEEVIVVEDPNKEKIQMETEKPGPSKPRWTWPRLNLSLNWEDKKKGQNKMEKGHKTEKGQCQNKMEKGQNKMEKGQNKMDKDDDKDDKHQQFRFQMALDKKRPAAKWPEDKWPAAKRPKGVTWHLAKEDQKDSAPEGRLAHNDSAPEGRLVHNVGDWLGPGCPFTRVVPRGRVWKNIVVGGAPRLRDGGYEVLKPFSDVIGIVVNCQCFEKAEEWKQTAFKGLWIVSSNPNHLMNHGSRGGGLNKPEPLVVEKIQVFEISTWLTQVF